MKVGEHKGIDIYFDEDTEDFFTEGDSIVGSYGSESYTALKMRIDRKLRDEGITIKTVEKENDLKPTSEFTRQDYVNNLVGGSKTYDNVTFNNCNFITPEGYDKLSAGDKTLIENLIKSLNEKII